ncbi:MAG: HAMP domain-containing histidine kinase, partial [Caulobacterales bacterium]|nr:HAMP domain-containing histidine kinase [Caulobacterales bacterium]
AGGADAEPDGANWSAPALEVLPEPVIVVSADGHIEAANVAARDFFVITEPFLPLTTVLRAPEVLEAVALARRRARPVSVSYTAMAPRERHMRAFVAGLPAGGTGAGGAVIALRDETTMRRAERMRVDFLANASHELRTPLASLAGFIDTLRGHARDDPEAQERFLAIMSAESNRMRRLIDDLLSLSRVELNEHVPPRGGADLAAIAGDVVDAVAPLAGERDIAIEVRREEPRAPVTGDRDQLVQVVRNLIDNAVKYSEPGGRVVVTIGCGAAAGAAAHGPERIAAHADRMSIVSPHIGVKGSFAWLRVRDYGPGIAGQHLPRLAERLFRVEDGEAEKRSGTGLGLAIVKHIMSRHRGGFSVESAPGEGSVFSVYVPHTQEFARAGPARLTREPAESAA